MAGVWSIAALPEWNGCKNYEIREFGWFEVVLGSVDLSLTLIKVQKFSDSPDCPELSHELVCQEDYCAVIDFSGVASSSSPGTFPPRQIWATGAVERPVFLCIAPSTIAPLNFRGHLTINVLCRQSCHPPTYI